MNAKHGFAGTVLLALMTGPLALAQAPMNLPASSTPTGGDGLTTPAAPPAGMPPTGTTYMLSQQPSGAPAPGAMPPVPMQRIPAPAGPPAGGLPYTIPPTSPPPGTIPLDPAPTPGLPEVPGLPSTAPSDPNLIINPPPQTSSPSALCCGPTGKHGPIGTEIYVQTGPSFVLSNSAFGKSLNTGYEVGLVGRTLFFNPEGTRDWNILLDVNFTNNNGVPSNIFNFQNQSGAPFAVTIRNLNRTAAGLGLGYDWFLLGSGNVGYCNGPNLSTGFDGGARWGTAHVDLNIVGTGNNGYAREQHIYGEGFAGWRTNFEMPMGGWTWLAGLRAEFSYSSLHVLPFHQNTGLYNLNLLFTTGVRY